MFNIKVPERMKVEEPKNLSAMQAFAWDYFFNNGWYIFKLDDSAEGYLILDESLNLENAFFMNTMDGVKDWLTDSGVNLLFSED